MHILYVNRFHSQVRCTDNEGQKGREEKENNNNKRSSFHSLSILKYWFCRNERTPPPPPPLYLLASSYFWSIQSFLVDIEISDDYIHVNYLSRHDFHTMPCQPTNHMLAISLKTCLLMQPGLKMTSG